MTRVCNLKPRAALLMVGLLGTLLVLALGACGGEGEAGDQEKAKARTLPPVETTLSPGEYRSEEFEPSFSFRVGEGWSNGVEELPDYFQLRYQGEIGSIQFANVKEVFKPATTNVEKAPKDLVGWLQQHPYLKTSKPQPVTVGGVEGEQLEVLIDHLPRDHDGYCGEPSGCLDIFNLSGGDEIGYFGKNFNARRLIVLENVEGERVVIWYAGPPETFEKFAPKAQKVIDSVKWGGS